MRSIKLLFAVRLKDEFAPAKPPVGKTDVNLVGRPEKPIVNRSGLYCFVELASGSHSIAVKARYYCDKTVEVDTSALDPKLPAVDVYMSPNLNYPFPKRTTLVRGVVRIKNEPQSTVPGARVRIKKTDKVFLTDERGRFIFYFHENGEDEDEPQEEFKLICDKAGYKTKRVNFEPVKEKTTFIEIKLKPE